VLVIGPISARRVPFVNPLTQLAAMTGHRCCGYRPTRPVLSLAGAWHAVLAAPPVWTCTLLTRLRAAMFWRDFREQFIPHFILQLNCSALAYLCAPLIGMHLSLQTVLV
jgi:hypothetical protein